MALTVLVGGTSLGEAVLLCETDVDAVEKKESDGAQLDDGELEEMREVVDDVDALGALDVVGFDGVGICVPDPEYVPDCVDEPEADPVEDGTLENVEETDVEPERDGPFENVADTDVDIETAFGVSEGRGEGESTLDMEADPVNEPEVDEVNDTDGEPDGAAEIVMIVAVAQDAVPDRLGDADAE